jgi:hypothetical protein
MTNDEKILLSVLEHCSNQNQRAVVIQSFIADMGPLSEEAGEKVRELLKSRSNGGIL